MLLHPQDTLCAHNLSCTQYDASAETPGLGGVCRKHITGRMTSIARASLRAGGKPFRGSLCARGMSVYFLSKYSCVSRRKLWLLMTLFELTMSTWTMVVTSFSSYRGFGCCLFTSGIKKFNCFVYCRSWLLFHLHLHNFYVSICLQYSNRTSPVISHIPDSFLLQLLLFFPSIHITLAVCQRPVPFSLVTLRQLSPFLKNS